MAILLLIPFFLIRFGLLYLLDKTAIRRAAHFAPMEGVERVASILYQLSNVALFVYLFFLKISFKPAGLFYAGAAFYLAGNILLAVSMVNFAAPPQTGIKQRGLYAISRNPIYVSYFVYFIGCVLLTQSLALLALVLLFQASSHWVILAEERWCVENFGEEYRRYMKRVRRYL